MPIVNDKLVSQFHYCSLFITSPLRTTVHIVLYSWSSFEFRMMMMMIPAGKSMESGTCSTEQYRNISLYYFGTRHTFFIIKRHVGERMQGRHIHDICMIFSTILVLTQTQREVRAIMTRSGSVIQPGRRQKSFIWISISNLYQESWRQGILFKWEISIIFLRYNIGFKLLAASRF